MQLERLGLDPVLPLLSSLGVGPLRRHLAGEVSLEAAIGEGQTESRQYAEQHGRNILRGKFKIKSLKVYPDELMVYGDPHEFIYVPRSVEIAHQRLYGRPDSSGAPESAPISEMPVGDETRFPLDALRARAGVPAQRVPAVEPSPIPEPEARPEGETAREPVTSEPAREPAVQAPDRAEGGFFRGQRPARPTVAPASPLADIDRMVRTDPAIPLKERLRAVKERVIETQVNRFEPVRKLTTMLRDLGAPPRPGEAPIELMELAKNKMRGQAQAFTARLDRIVKEAGDLGLDESLNHFLTLEQFDKRIRDLSARPLTESNLDTEGHRLDPTTGARIGFVNPQEFDRQKIEAGFADLRRALTPGQMQAVERMAESVWALNRDLLTRARDAGIVSA